MRHLAPAEHDRDLDLGPFLEKIHYLVPLRLKIVSRGAGSHLDFFQSNGLLILPRFVLPLTKLIEVLPVIDDAANWRIGSRGNLHQVQTLSLREFQGLEGRHNSELRPFFINHSDFLGANPLIHSNESVGDISSLPAPTGAQ